MADLFHRVSIRKFKDEAVSNEDIGYILEAAMAAPSAKNQQPWEFYVVENREVLKRLGEGSRRDSVPSASLLSVTRMRSGPSRIGSIRAGSIM